MPEQRYRKKSAVQTTYLNWNLQGQDIISCRTHFLEFVKKKKKIKEKKKEKAMPE